MRHPFVSAWEFETWARSIANAIRVYAGRIDELPPYSFPAIIRDPSADVPTPAAVPPELLTDWGALIDEVNTAITETFADAPATMTPYEMPDIIAAHASTGGPYKFIKVTDFYVANGAMVIYDYPTSIKINSPKSIMMIADCSNLRRQSGAPSTSVVSVQGTSHSSTYNASIEGGALVSTYCGLASGADYVSFSYRGGEARISYESSTYASIAILQDAGGAPGATYEGTGTIYIAIP